MLELAILGLLKEQPLHGYELKKRLGETLGSLWGVSFGSLYPALRRLERDGAIEVVDAATGRRRAADARTGSLDGRRSPPPALRPRRHGRAGAPARPTASPTAARRRFAELLLDRRRRAATTSAPSP